jgi:DNA-directed RNA polymerase subunit RPC12/RpoP
MPTDITSDEQEPSYRCTHCQRNLFHTELDRHACYLCENRANKHLAALPLLYADLGTHALQPGTGIRTARVTGASKTAPLPVSLHTLTLRGPGGIITLLQDVEDSWRRARRSRIHEQASVTDKALANIVTYLSINLAWACESYEDIADDLDTISRLYWQARNALSGKPPRLIPVRCRLLYDDGQECGAEMLVDINRTSAKCGECGTRWGSHEWMDLFEAVRQTAA